MCLLTPPTNPVGEVGLPPPGQWETESSREIPEEQDPHDSRKRAASGRVRNPEYTVTFPPAASES